MSWIATVTCTQDPCTYCRIPARTIRLEFPRGRGPVSTEEAAREHGRNMANNVYGASTHRVDVIEVGTAQELARDLLSFTAAAKRPVWFWREDQRIQRAINTLGITADEAIEEYTS